MPSLLEQEEHAAKFTKALIGTWVGEREPGGGFKAVERKEFRFQNDGTVSINEKMKGQTDPYLKEDWQFLSWGTWKIKGDTAFINITREKCARQIFWNKKDGKWEKKVQPTYDSTITGGIKDRYMTWEFMQEELKKF